MKRILLSIVILHFFSTTFGQEVKYKFGEGLRFTSKESTFDIKLTGRIQTLFTSERILEDGSSWEQELFIRRARLKANGHLFSTRFSYKFEFGLSERDRITKTDRFSTAKVPEYILDAVLKYKINDYLEIWGGQTKLPGNRERVVSSQNLQFVDRSLVNSIFNLDREMGLQLRSKFEFMDMLWRPSASISLGEGRNSVFSSLGGYHYTGRVELLPFGEFKSKGEYFDSDLKREETPKLLVGITYSFNDNSMRQKATGNYLVDAEGNYLQNDVSTFFADAVFKYKGLSISSEYANKMVILGSMGSSEAPTFRSTIVDDNNKSYLTGSGFNFQVAYLFKNNFEIGTRATKVAPNTEASFKGLTEYTLGISQYLNGHKLKVQGDLSYSNFEESSPNKLRYRLQFEIGF